MSKRRIGKKRDFAARCAPAFVAIQNRDFQLTKVRTALCKSGNKLTPIRENDFRQPVPAASYNTGGLAGEPGRLPIAIWLKVLAALARIPLAVRRRLNEELLLLGTSRRGS